MSGAARTDAERARMNGLFALLRGWSQGSFEHDGLIYAGVPKDVVVGFVAARFDGRDTVVACIAAFAGEAVTAAHARDGGWLGWRVARAWSWKLSDIEARHAPRREAA